MFPLRLRKSKDSFCEGECGINAFVGEMEKAWCCAVYGCCSVVPKEKTTLVDAKLSVRFTDDTKQSCDHRDEKETNSISKTGKSK